MIKRLALIGTGLIGGSLVRALKKQNYCQHVVACGRNQANLTKAVSLGVADSYEQNPALAVAGADMIVVSVPLGAMRQVFEDIVPNLDSGAVVTDVGSAKTQVLADMKSVTGEMPSWFVPGHPIAGTEQSGVEASFATLFQDKRVILTPVAETQTDALEKVKLMWQKAGADVVMMDVNQHDRVLAATSHLPHMLAFGLVNQLADRDHVDRVFQYAAGGFRDISRIASSDAVMWRDICLGNRQAILDSLAQYQVQLSDLMSDIKNGDSMALEEYFQRAKSARDEFVE
jgi:prephenate dehydrogenase